MVLLGTGPCARAAETAARAAGAQRLSLKARFSLRRLVFIAESEEHRERLRRRTLEALKTAFKRAERPGARPRIFLAGGQPKHARLLPTSMNETLSSMASVHTRRVWRDAFARTAEGIGFAPARLRDVLAEPLQRAPRCSSPSPAVLAAVADLQRAARGNAMQRRRPRIPRDCHAAGHCSGVSSALLEAERSVVLHRDEDVTFELAFVDVDLLSRYARAGYKRILIGDDVVLVEPRRIARYCRWRGLNLLQTGC